MKSNKGKLILVECKELPVNLGFDTSRCLRLKTSRDFDDYVELFCKDRYKACPYYCAWLKESENMSVQKRGRSG